MRTVSLILAVSTILVSIGCANTSISKISFKTSDNFEVGIELTQKY